MDEPAEVVQLDAAIIRAWADTALRLMIAHRTEIDQLNVFPIADRDTGTNLVHTLAGARQAVFEAGDVGAVALMTRMAQGALTSAHGNSGTILAQVLGAMAISFAAEPGPAVESSSGLDVASLQRALTAAAAAAYEAVLEPVEGTILTVLVAAERAARGHESLAGALTAGVEGAAYALARTSDQLEELAAAGVVDAGGAGALLLLQALLCEVTATAPARLDLLPAVPGETVTAFDSGPGQATASGRFEVQYLLPADPEQIAALRGQLAMLGDSVSVASAGAGLYAVHAHVADPGAAVEAALDAGRPSKIRITQLQTDRPLASGVAILSVVENSSLQALFQADQVHSIQSRDVTVEQIAAALIGCGAERIVVLPNSAQNGAVAELAARQVRRTGLGVAVVPTRSAVQGLAAVAVHDRGRRFDDDVIAMAEAAAATRVAEVWVAVEDSFTYAGRCSAGDVLGLIDGEVVEIGSDYGRVASALVRRLIAAGGELVTVLAADRPEALSAAAALRDYVHTRHRLVEVSVLAAGAQLTPLVIGVE